jgi:hypothetical protein
MVASTSTASVTGSSGSTTAVTPRLAPSTSSASLTAKSRS